MDALRRGRIARDAARWADAETAFRAALAAAHPGHSAATLRAEIIGEIGLAELRQKKHRDAAEHLDEALTLGGTALRPALERRFAEGQRIAEKYIGRLYLSVEPPDAEVLVDGKVIPNRGGAYNLFLDPGRHGIRARLAGYDDDQANFEVAAGLSTYQEMRLRLPSSSRPAAIPVAPRVSTHAATPVKRADASASTWRTVGIVTSAVTAAVGVAALIGQEALSGEIEEASAEIKERSGPFACRGASGDGGCTQLDDAERGRVALSWIGVTSLVASGVIAGLTVRSFLSSPEPSRQKTGIRIVPVAGPSSGLLIYGSF